MNLTLTTATGRYPRIGGAEQIINVTQGGCAATITARYSAMCYSNILTLAHYPMTAILREYD